jgi:transcriptional regulator with XRE-family HTH domain
MRLRLKRNALGISQSRLARLSGVSRFKICTYELGGGSLSQDERQRVHAALLAEADRLRSLPGRIKLTTPEEVQ